jgi:hypothetical protein
LKRVEDELVGFRATSTLTKACRVDPDLLSVYLPLK